MSTTKLTSVRHLALDMDGTIYKGGTVFEFTLPFLERMSKLGIGYTFLTNNSSKSVVDYLQSLGCMGIAADREQVFTSTWCAVYYLRQALPAVKRLYVLGTPSLQSELVMAGFTVVGDEEEPEAVVVGFDTGLVYPRLCKAAWWIKRGKPFIATHPDRICPTDRPTVLVDCGAVCACLESATGQSPQAVLGKPDPWMLRGILDRHRLQAPELAMVGDRLYTDMVMARRAGCVGVLVLTGEATVDDTLHLHEPPDVIVPSLKELGEMLAQAREQAGAMAALPS
ncbi:MAG TPA: HAD-IIA family hydrolase [Phycisphaerae bacterium]|nr:HAD-IIA family hydrolase [Phycisphaerae bacterium]HRY67562.1 HAD-IIA family hydrolase [Phycisphaerae bacterium]HSA24949.1 HAD-IIA family hydrolase [Phycisphaerae bacterium]